MGVRMMKHVQKIILFIIIITACLALIGCDGKKQAISLNEDTFITQEDSPEDDISIADTSIADTSIADISIADTSKVNDRTDTTSSDNKDTEESDKIEAEVVENDAEIVFIETSDTVYATSNVKIRSSYSTEENNIVSVLKKGDSVNRIGSQKEWSKVLYQDEICYIKADYLTLAKPIVEETSTPTPSVTKSENTAVPAFEESFVADLSLAADINQLVCVIGEGGSNCTVSFHTKDTEGKWQQQFSIAGDNGSKGITYNKTEGDKETPAGLYSFTLAFGIKPDPGANIPYRQITDYDYWVDDVTSPYYNTWVNSQELPGDYNSEHLIDHNPSYNYALNIDYNWECNPELGSAIFLHCYNGLGRTTGCIAISEEGMKTLIQEIDSSAKILIVPSSAELANY